MDRDPLIHVSVEMPAQYAPELMKVLGDFAVAHEGDINIGISRQLDEIKQPQASTNEAVAKPEASQPAYNPELVTFLPDEQGEEIPVLTKLQAAEFAKKYGIAPTPRVARLFGALGVQSVRTRADLRPFIYPEELHKLGVNILGIRAALIGQLAFTLKAMPVDQIKDKGREVLDALHQNLYLPEAPGT